MDRGKMRDGIEIFLQGLGVDLENQHLKGTPDRVARAWMQEFGNGYLFSDEEVKNLLSVEFADKYDEMIVVKDIDFVSHCSHHIVPILGKAKVGYVPDGKVVGLSKLGRIVDVFAHRLQVQERLTIQVAEAINKHLKPKGVGVIIEATHACMACRGAKKPNSKMITSCLLGKMRSNKSMREEFLNF